MVIVFVSDRNSVRARSTLRWLSAGVVSTRVLRVYLPLCGSLGLMDVAQVALL